MKSEWEFSYERRKWKNILIEELDADYGTRRKNHTLFCKMNYLVLQKGIEKECAVMFEIMCRMNNAEVFIPMRIWLMPADFRVLPCD
jgi:hypothetical protein